MDNQDAANQLSAGERHLAEEYTQRINDAVHSNLAMLVDASLKPGVAELAEYATVADLLAALPPKSVMAVVKFQNTMQGTVAFVLDTPSAIQVSDILIGGSASDPTAEITDIQTGAVGEAISQITGVLSSGLSQFLSNPVDITSPEVMVLTPEKLAEVMPDLAAGACVGIQYSVTDGQTIPGLVMTQIMSLQTMKQHVKVVGGAMQSDPTLKHSDDTVSEAKPQEEAGEGEAGPGANYVRANGEEERQYAGGSGPARSGRFADGGSMEMPGGPVTVQPVAFPSFDNYASANGGINKNLELVMDVCLNLTVELGRTERPIKDILELTRGSVIELEKIAGEPVDLYANGKMIAKGEVVVIEDNFGLRITSIVAPAERIRGL